MLMDVSNSNPTENAMNTVCFASDSELDRAFEIADRRDSADEASCEFSEEQLNAAFFLVMEGRPATDTRIVIGDRAFTTTTDDEGRPVVTEERV